MTEHEILAKLIRQWLQKYAPELPEDAPTPDIFDAARNRIDSMVSAAQRLHKSIETHGKDLRI